jgi:hypothetical protein
MEATWKAAFSCRFLPFLLVHLIFHHVRRISSSSSLFPDVLLSVISFVLLNLPSVFSLYFLFFYFGPVTHSSDSSCYLPLPSFPPTFLYLLLAHCLHLHPPPPCSLLFFSTSSPYFCSSIYIIVSKEIRGNVLLGSRPRVSSNGCINVQLLYIGEAGLPLCYVSASWSLLFPQKY